MVDVVAGAYAKRVETLTLVMVTVLVGPRAMMPPATGPARTVAAVSMLDSINICLML